jgi:demethoxyubiquinone hydroxylase (CLK1/Coq7/Cat5 family)
VKEESASYRGNFFCLKMNEQAAMQKFEEVEKKIEELKARQLELLSKEENELTRREKAELARHDSELADLKKDKADWIEIIKKGVEGKS